MRQRKTRDYWEIHAHHGPGTTWECVNTEMTRADAIRSIREHRANYNFPVKLVKKRERIEPSPLQGHDR
jgi:hypothetical protein